MYLKSIELNGFKSFAKKSTLTFNTPISAIVGPNGSGKSNIAESFRFVLGEQSIKSMRGKKGEDMIWNGSGEIPRMGRASVKVIFDNTQRFLPIDFDEVTIERVVHRDSVNEYFLNNSLVRLKDIVELLASAHIGSSGHHIISQGEADRILNTTSKERKSMIEDALGLKLYQYKKIESQKKLQKTRENISKIELQKREIIPHLRFLKKQVEKVEKLAITKTELLDTARLYFKTENYFINETRHNILQRQKPLEELMKDLENKLNDAKNILALSDKSDNTSTELIDLEEHIREVREKKELLLSEHGRIEGEIFAELRIIKKQEELVRNNDHKTVRLNAVDDVYKEISHKVSQIENENDIETIKMLVIEAQEILSGFILTHRDAIDTGVMEEANYHIQKLSLDKKNIEAKQQELIAHENAHRESYNELKQKIEREKDVNRDAEKDVFRLMSEEQTVRSKLYSLKSEEESLNHFVELFTSDLSDLSQILGRDVLQFEAVEINTNEDRHAQSDRKRQIEKLKFRLEESGAAGGSELMKEYKEVTEREEFLSRELLDLENSATSLSGLISELEEKLEQEFTNGLSKINTQFSQYFALMFGGGSAELLLIRIKKRVRSVADILDDGGNMDEPSETEEGDIEVGIEIDVSLPRKKIKGLMMLSGGERALTSIALLFAISQVNPPPFIILDETDAALDEANSKKYGDMIELLGEHSQLIVITHNRESMSRAGVIYGVTMGHTGGSTLLSVAFEEAVVVAK